MRASETGYVKMSCQEGEGAQRGDSPRLAGLKYEAPGQLCRLVIDDRLISSSLTLLARPTAFSLDHCSGATYPP